MRKQIEHQRSAQAISLILAQRIGITIALVIEASIISAILLLKY